MLRPIPELKLDVPRTMGRALIRGEERRISISLEEYEERHKPIWNLLNRVVEQCGVKLLDPRPILCPAGRCWGDVEGLPIYYDDDHLNERGGQLLVPLFQQIFAEPVNKTAGRGRVVGIPLGTKCWTRPQALSPGPSPKVGEGNWEPALAVQCDASSRNRRLDLLRRRPTQMIPRIHRTFQGQHVKHILLDHIGELTQFVQAELRQI